MQLLRNANIHVYSTTRKKRCLWYSHLMADSCIPEADIGRSLLLRNKKGTERTANGGTASERGGSKQSPMTSPVSAVGHAHPSSSARVARAYHVRLNGVRRSWETIEGTENQIQREKRDILLRRPAPCSRLYLAVVSERKRQYKRERGICGKGWGTWCEAGAGREKESGT